MCAYKNCCDKFWSRTASLKFICLYFKVFRNEVWHPFPELIVTAINKTPHQRRRDEEWCWKTPSRFLLCPSWERLTNMKGAKITKESKVTGPLAPGAPNSRCTWDVERTTEWVDIITSSVIYVMLTSLDTHLYHHSRVSGPFVGISCINRAM